MKTVSLIKAVIFLAAIALPFTTLAVDTGGAIPACKLSSIDGKQNADLREYQKQGKVLYVDFWASWCGPCAKSFPFLNEMQEQLKAQGLQIVGVNLDENPDDAKAFLAKYPAQFTVLADASQDKQCAKDFDVKAMPSSYIIDQQGKVHQVNLGFKSGESEEIRAVVEKLLAGKVAGL